MIKLFNMKQLLALTTVFLLICKSLNGQKNAILDSIINKYSKIESYKCDVNFSYENSARIDFSNTMEIFRNSNDTTIGFWYFFHRDLSKQEQNIADFNIYNGESFINSNKHKLEKYYKKDSPQIFIDSKIKKNKNIPPIEKSPLLFNVSLFEIQKYLKKNINNPQIEISQEQDSLIDKILSICFKFSNISNNSTTITTIYFDKKTYFPTFYRKESTNSIVKIKLIITAAFKNIEYNYGISQSYFSESNLIPKGWEKDTLNESNNLGLSSGDVAPNWELPALIENKSENLKSYKGNFVLLEFTETWCSHCLDALPMMSELHKKFESNGKLKIFSIYSNGFDTQNSLLKFAQIHNIQNTILYNAKEVGTMYHIKGYPEFFILDKNEKILFHEEGYSDDIKQKIESIIEGLIAAK
jgi:thiol-disulfide isomerase/thioredoxin/outer membrane lipoprotein-sorting protein